MTWQHLAIQLKSALTSEIKVNSEAATQENVTSSLGQNVRLEEGYTWVGSFHETQVDPQFLSRATGQNMRVM